MLPRTNRPLAEMTPQGNLSLHFHPGQTRAWRSQARFILVLAGTRSGKTSWAPWWLWREIQAKGPGDYLLCAPTFRLLDKAAVPFLNDALNVKLGLGKVVGRAQGHFVVSKAGEYQLWSAAQDRQTRIVFGHADEPDSLEAAQYKAAVCDEAGQKKFKQESWEAIQRRLAIDKGRCLFPTTPYSLGWLKSEVFDRAMRYASAKVKGLPYNQADADYEVINFKSIENPAFPLDEYERAKASLPRWKFRLFYEGIFERPAGAVYDCFDSEFHRIPGGFIPANGWRLHCGIDFGAPNFAAVFLAEEPGTQKLVAFAEYRPEESRNVREHIAAMKEVVRKACQLPEGRIPDVCVGGAKSEGQWRQEFAAAGWPIHQPDQPDVEVGITRTYAGFREDKLFITEDCPRLLSDVLEYSREVDELGNVTNDIEDKESFHSADALRYIVSYLRRASVDFYFRVD